MLNFHPKLVKMHIQDTTATATRTRRSQRFTLFDGVAVITGVVLIGYAFF